MRFLRGASLLLLTVAPIVARGQAGPPARGAAPDSVTHPDTAVGRLACSRRVAWMGAWTRAARAIDTTITLAIADRTWQRENVDAGIALGAGGTAGASQAPWQACAGASAHLGSVTAHLHQVRGTIHLTADPRALASLGHVAGTTPPAGPPRR